MNTVKFDNGIHVKVEYAGAANALVEEGLRVMAGRINALNALLPLCRRDILRRRARAWTVCAATANYSARGLAIHD